MHRRIMPDLPLDAATMSHGRSRGPQALTALREDIDGVVGASGRTLAYPSRGGAELLARPAKPIYCGGVLTVLKRSDVLVAASWAGFVAPVASSNLRLTSSGWAEYRRVGGADELRLEHRFSAEDMSRINETLQGLPPQVESDAVIDDALWRTMHFRVGEEARRVDLERLPGASLYPALERIEALWAWIHHTVEQRGRLRGRGP
jgi:hypothetical protein